MSVHQRAHAPATTPHVRMQDVLLGAAGGIVVGAALDASSGDAIVPLLLGAALLLIAVVGALIPPTEAAGASEQSGGRPALQLGSGVDWWRHFGLEFERSRRYDHPLALISVPCPAGVEPDWVVGRVATHLRRLDTAFLDGRRVLILLPESDRSDGDAFAARLAAAEPDFVRLDDIRVAAFPEDALTSAALLDRVAAPGSLALDPGFGSPATPERLRRVAHLRQTGSGTGTSGRRAS